MTKQILINTIDEEESRMAIVENGKLVEYNVQMSVKEPTTGNIYKAIVRKVERGLQAAFVDFGSGKNGFLPLHDVIPEYFTTKEGEEGAGKGKDRPTLAAGQEVLVQVAREAKNNKGAMLTTQISLPGRYLVLMPNRRNIGISRKIEKEAERTKLREIVDKIAEKEEMGFIVRTAGVNRTKQELLRDYQILLRLWKDIVQKADKTQAPALVYQESDFAVRSLRDYFTSDVTDILVDNIDTYRKMRNYFKIVSPRNVKMIKQYKEDTPLFDRYRIEEQIGAIYRERVDLKSGGYLIITPTEAMTTIDVNSGRGSSRKDVEETAFRTNLEAAEEIARQLRLRDLGGLIVVDFIDMREVKHNNTVEKNFKKSMSVDRARIQMSKISRFGMLELSRQRKQSTIQEISHTACPHCGGTGLRPSMEYLALNTYRRIKSEAVKGNHAAINVSLPYEVNDYLLNQKRAELSKLESAYGISIHIAGDRDLIWGESRFEVVKREGKDERVIKGESEQVSITDGFDEEQSKAHKKEQPRKKRNHRRRRPKSQSAQGDQATPAGSDGAVEPQDQPAELQDDPAQREDNREDFLKEKKKLRFFDIFRFS
ncbi:MAG: Rne/Rng family ribonuclease [Deltaproteobacteria bacterium]|nr:Rne/Rng family ribonuclease [Deltaproteobacteria bacterium]